MVLTGPGLAAVFATNGTVTPAGGSTSGSQPTFVEQARAFLEALASTEGRLAVTVGIVLLALVIVGFLVPRVLRVIGAWTVDRVLSDRLSRSLESSGDYVPTTTGGVIVRGMQVSVLVVAAFGLLVVWDLEETVLAVATELGLSVSIALSLLVTLGLLLVAYAVSDLLQTAVGRFGEGADRVTDHQQEIVIRIGQLSILAVVFSGVLTVWGVDLSGLLVGAGFLGIVLGLAARQTLGSMIAGFVLMFSRPFTIGDWVVIDDQEGIVTDITIFNTRLETFDGEFVVMPNDRVGDSAITNRSKKGHLRLRVDVGVDYESDPEHAKEVALDAISDLDAVETSPSPQVIPKAFGDSAVVLELRFWIDRPTPPRKWRAQAAVVSGVKSAFEAEGIKIPFPQRELTGRAETGGLHVRGGEPATAEGDGSDRSGAGHRDGEQRGRDEPSEAPQDGDSDDPGRIVPADENDADEAAGEDADLVDHVTETRDDIPESGDPSPTPEAFVEGEISESDSSRDGDSGTDSDGDSDGDADDDSDDDSNGDADN